MTTSEDPMEKHRKLKALNVVFKGEVLRYENNRQFRSVVMLIVFGTSSKVCFGNSWKGKFI